MAETIPGGRYRRPDGTIVNANGEAIEASLPHDPETTQVAVKADAPSARWNKAQLTEYAAQHGIDITSASTNAEILAAIQAAAASENDDKGDSQTQ